MHHTAAPRWNDARNPIALAAIATAALLALGAGHLVEQQAGTPAPLVSSLAGTAPATSAAALHAARDYARLPLRFEANRGQTDSRVDFLARGPGYSVFLTGPDAVLSIVRRSALPARSGERAASIRPDRHPDGAVIRMRLLGASANPAIATRQPLAGKTNYLVGKNRREWQTGVPGYGKVRYQSVYPGTDVVYYGRQGRLEYDFVVAPGATTKPIALGFTGARRLSLDRRGDLILTTPTGRLRQHRPVVYQRVGGRRRAISGSYVLRGRRAVGFRVGAYDHQRPLTIDPVLSYSTYLGEDGNGNSAAAGIAVDASGSAYVTGQTASANFPTTPNAFDRACDACAGFPTDAYITKLSPSGNTLDYSTYLGGNTGSFPGSAGQESAGGVSVRPTCSSTCSAFVSGRTTSTDFPIVNGIQTTLSGSGDAYLAELSGDGTNLLYSTYFGGSGAGNTEAFAKPSIAVDASGDAYLSGQTEASDLRTTAGAYDRICGTAATPCTDSAPDAYVAKFDTALIGLNSLVYSTYLGGGASDTSAGVAVDASGRAYVTGNTTSSDLPAGSTAGAKPGYGGGTDVYVARLNAAGSVLDYSTYLGGTSSESAGGIAVDGVNAYVAGGTRSPDFPTTPGAYQTVKRESADAFVAKLDTASGGAGSLVYSTYLGAERDAPVDSTQATAIAVDSSGSAYVTGATNTIDFPTVGAFRPAGQDAEAFVTKLDAAGSTLDYSTYLGGDGSDGGVGIALPSSCAPPCRAFVTGNTDSVDFPTKDPFQSTLQGRGDPFVTALDPAPAPAAPAIRAMSVHTGPAEGGTTVTITGVNFSAATAVSFGTVPAASFSVDPSGRTITAVTPDHSGTIVDVTVTGPGGVSLSNRKTKFLFGLGRWRASGTMKSPRFSHTATLLSNGKVLVTGGAPNGDFQADPVSSAELYDPKTGTWSATGDLTVPRAEHTATLLTGSDCKASSPPAWCGKVLITGGYSAFDPMTFDLALLASAELYDPATGVFTAVPDTPAGGSPGAGLMSSPRLRHTATMLPNGTVLLADGCAEVGGCAQGRETVVLAPSADIFDPQTNTFTQPPNPGFGRVGHTATLLPSGKVLLVGGTQEVVQDFTVSPYQVHATLAPAELYDPANKSWTAAGREGDLPADHSATLLQDDRVLVAGGSDGGPYPTFKKSGELYDPPTDSWSNAGSLQKIAHSQSPGVLLPNGQVLVASGAGSPDGALSDPANAPFTNDLSELFDPSANSGRGTWRTAMPTLFGRDPGRTPNHTAILLSSDPERFAADPGVCGENCGKVLVAGGEAFSANGFTQEVTDTSELYSPAPTITDISPASGPTPGGTTVTITGTGFTHNVSDVRFGDSPATSFTVDSFSRITAVSPPAATAAGVPVTVINDGGKGQSTFDYVADAPVAPTPAGADTTTPARDTTAPVIRRLRATPPAFRIGRLLPRLTTSTARTRTGTLISFSLSEAAKVRLTFALRRGGRLVAGRCRTASRRLAGRPRCARYISIQPGVRITGARAGSNRLRFQGRLSPTRTLRPGRYRMTATATDAAGNRSRPASALVSVRHRAARR